MHKLDALLCAELLGVSYTGTPSQKAKAFCVSPASWISGDSKLLWGERTYTEERGTWVSADWQLSNAFERFEALLMPLGVICRERFRRLCCFSTDFLWYFCSLGFYSQVDLFEDRPRCIWLCSSFPHLSPGNSAALCLTSALRWAPRDLGIAALFLCTWIWNSSRAGNQAAELAESRLPSQTIPVFLGQECWGVKKAQASLGEARDLQARAGKRRALHDLSLSPAESTRAQGPAVLWNWFGRGSSSVDVGLWHILTAASQQRGKLPVASEDDLWVSK